MTVKFTLQNSKIAKYGSDFTSFENIAKINKTFVLKHTSAQEKIIFEFFDLIKYFLLIISILGILDLAHRKNLVQANVQDAGKKIMEMYISGES